MAKVLIDTILGGHSPSTHYAGKGQFRASLGIDPSQPIDDQDSPYSTIASGLLRPAASQEFSGGALTSAPLWMVGNPKDAFVYVYDANSSAYTIDSAFATVTPLSDIGALSGNGNGCEYYDNYIYFATAQDIARYGPLNGTAKFTPSYWQTTLSLPALANTPYPTSYKNKLQLPNHVLHRHSDGRLYIADVVGNQGTIHYIQTSKSSVEGDTNAGSTNNKLMVGYGLWPTAIESYQSDLAIAFIELSGNSNRQMRSKLAFWDTVSSSVNTLIWVEFPDQMITAMKNVDGTLYVASGQIGSRGFRVTAFKGGYSFSEVFNSETGESPLPGAMDGIMSQVIAGSHTTVPEQDGCVYGMGLSKLTKTTQVFNIMRCTGGTASSSVTAVGFLDNDEMGFDTPIIGWTQAGDGSTGASHGLNKQGVQYNNAPSMWWSEMYRIGMQFKIQKIRIPLTIPVALNQILTVKVYTDDGTNVFTYAPINISNYPTYPDNANIRLRGATDASGVVRAPTGFNNFWVELRWTGSALMTVGLPIEVDLEVTDN